MKKNTYLCKTKQSVNATRKKTYNLRQHQPAGKCRQRADLRPERNLRRLGQDTAVRPEPDRLDKQPDHQRGTQLQLRQPK